MAESALFSNPAGATLGLTLYTDRAVITNPEQHELMIPFSEVEALAYVEPTRIGFVNAFDTWFQQSGVRLAVLFEGNWVHLPAVPLKLAEELVSNWRKAALRIDDWPWDPASPPPPSIIGSLVVREYPDSGAFQREAAVMARAGYDVISTTQQQQNASGAMWLLAGPIAAMASKKTYLVVTYQLRR